MSLASAKRMPPLPPTSVMEPEMVTVPLGQWKDCRRQRLQESGSDGQRCAVGRRQRVDLLLVLSKTAFTWTVTASASGSWAGVDAIGADRSRARADRPSGNDHSTFAGSPLASVAV
jgi:hypothetical protein